MQIFTLIPNIHFPDHFDDQNYLKRTYYYDRRKTAARP